MTILSQRLRGTSGAARNCSGTCSMEQQQEIVAESELTEPVNDMPQEKATPSEEIVEVAVECAPIEPTEVKKNVEDELKMLQSKYSEKESELERLKSALKNFIN